jgi:hypothetical protein
MIDEAILMMKMMPLPLACQSIINAFIQRRLSLFMRLVKTPTKQRMDNTAGKSSLPHEMERLRNDATHMIVISLCFRSRLPTESP